ncbi:lethal(2) giant larvae protein [Trichinella spiralis]|uniref:lethal(2) giant larvae protein n=1 Tax=Trichinella spiralis TaxID=6334 RepID=UPI0001EFBC68|nr:lethal(2) giant larvae protein [Trichinella spiralis]
MPRAACSDRNALSVQLNTHQVVFDFTSRVVDFCLFDEPVLDKEEGRGEPKLLLVLCEEELVGIDLTVDGWPCVRVPYFNAFHASPVTTCCHVSDLVRDCFDEICQYGLRQSLTTFALSDTPWPGYESSSSVLAKFPDNELANNPCLLITGHEDGTVKIWNVSWMDSPLLFVLNTACLYDSYQDPSDYSDDENVWPPFRKVGLYDPFSDDARFAVHRVCMDRNTGTVMVGGAAGQVTVWNLESEDKKHINIDCIDVNLVDGTEHFEWKGHASLKIRMDGMQFLAGYQPSVVIQCYPPASITACAASYAWSLITFGTAHGFAVFDCTSMRIIYKRCTLTPSEITPALTVSEGTISRYKSFKKSLRESFRRKRKPRSNRTSDCQSNKPKQRDNAEASTNSQRSYYHHHQLSRQAAVERAIEARSENKQQLNSLVRCATFASVNLRIADTLDRHQRGHDLCLLVEIAAEFSRGGELRFGEGDSFAPRGAGFGPLLHRLQRFIFARQVEIAAKPKQHGNAKIDRLLRGTDQVIFSTVVEIFETKVSFDRFGRQSNFENSTRDVDEQVKPFSTPVVCHRADQPRYGRRF